MYDQVLAPTDGSKWVDVAVDHAVEDRAGVAGTDCRTATEERPPGDRVEDYVHEHGVDLVVVGTHGRSGIERVLLGSTTERVLRRVDVPVLTVRGGG